MIFASFEVLLTFLSLLAVLFFATAIYFHRESSLLGQNIFLIASPCGAVLLFEGLTLLTPHLSEAILWTSGWLLAIMLFYPALLLYVGTLRHRGEGREQHRRLRLFDIAVICSGLIAYVLSTRERGIGEGIGTVILTKTGYLPTLNAHYFWYFGYFFVRIAYRYRDLFFQLFPKPGHYRWRRKLWYLFTALFTTASFIDIFAMAGFQVFPASQLFYTLLFLCLYAGVKFRFFFQVSAQFESAKIIQTIPDPFFVCDNNGEIRIANPPFCTVFGYSLEEIIGHNLFFTDNLENRRVVREILKLGNIRGLERVLYAKNGDEIQSSISVSRLVDSDGVETGAVVIVRDIRDYHHALLQLQEMYKKTEAVVQERTQELREANINLKKEIENRKEAQDRLHHVAYHDGLTGLPNREMFTERLQMVHSKYLHRKGKPFAILFIDLDRFKWINDSFGHLAGDEVLRETAGRLRDSLRDVDTIGRMGGDEFVVLLEDIDENRDVITASGRIIEAMQEPFIITDKNAEKKHEVSTTASIGIVISDPKYKSHPEMLRDADFALYRAKDAGKNRFEIFNEDIQADAAAFLELEGELRKAIRKEELLLFYQPIISMESRRLSGFEALIRWQHPRQGLLPPAEFIPIAEESDLIVDIDRWVMRRACSDLKTWLDNLDPAVTPEKFPGVSINVSARHLADNRLVDDISKVLSDTGLDPQLLTLEITESAIITNLSLAKKVLLDVKELGVALHLDDFGEGYSSVNLLKTVPFDGMKIDKAYVTGAGAKEQDSRLLKTIIDLGHAMDKHIIAEGIEEKEDAQLLDLFRCEHGQGFLFSKPVEEKQAGKLLSQPIVY